MKRIRLWLLLLIVLGVAGYLVFAVWSAQRRADAFAAFEPTPELRFHLRLREALNAGEPESASPELRPALEAISRWNVLIQREQKEDDYRAWNAAIKQWRAAGGWTKLSEEEQASIINFLDQHQERLTTIRESAALGGPIQVASKGSFGRAGTHFAATWASRLALDNVARAHSGELEAAIKDAVAGVQLFGALAQEPNFRTQIIRFHMASTTFAAIQEAFAPGVLPHDDAIRLIRLAQSFPGRDALLAGVKEGQRDSLITLQSKMLDLGWGGCYYELTARLGQPKNVLEQAKILVYASPVAAPWRNRDLEDLAETIKRSEPLAELEPYKTRAAMEAQRAELEERKAGPIARGYSGNYITVSQRYQADYEVDLKLLQIGLMLELYQKEHGAPPENLDAIATELPEASFIDPYSGKSFGYRRENDTFVLYSIAPNMVDDGGTHNPVQGDIVWRGVWKR